MSKNVFILILVALVLLLGMYLINSNMYPKTEVKYSEVGQGRGVFARAFFAPGEIIERCHTIKGDADEWGNVLSDYLFDSVQDDKTHLLALGNGSLYNHSDDPNATYEITSDPHITGYQLLIVKAVKPIKKSEEIFVSYGLDWFSDRNLTPK